MRISDWSSDVCSSDLVTLPNCMNSLRPALAARPTAAPATAAPTRTPVLPLFQLSAVFWSLWALLSPVLFDFVVVAIVTSSCSGRGNKRRGRPVPAFGSADDPLGEIRRLDRTVAHRDGFEPSTTRSHAGRYNPD